MMLLLKSALALAAAPLATATTLYAASYSGTVSTLDLTLSDGDDASLSTISETDGCAGSPAWLEIGEEGVVYCSDEGLTRTTGSVSAFSRGDEGLELVSRLDTEQGPVSSVRFGDGGLVVAHYATSMVNVLDVSDPAALTPTQNYTFALDEPGPDPGRQDAPHPHQAVLDPTGSFIVVPDLGADLVRIFAVGDDVSVEMLEPLAVEPGSGPRHVVFVEKGEGTVMYLISELTNTISGYEVGYPEGGIAFEEAFVIPTHGEGEEVPEGAAAAEILASPDGNFLTITSRNEAAYTIPNPAAPEDGDIPSDTLVVFSIADTGELTLIQKAPAGGLGPRHFSFNEGGDLLAVGLQDDQRVVVMRRDVETGEVGEIVAGVDVGGEVTCVLFDGERGGE